MLQAEDRAHRMGQKNPVNVKYLCAAGTRTTSCGPPSGANSKISVARSTAKPRPRRRGRRGKLPHRRRWGPRGADGALRGELGGRESVHRRGQAGATSRRMIPRAVFTRATFAPSSARARRDGTGSARDGDDDDDENENENVHGVVDLTAEEKRRRALSVQARATFSNPSRAEACEMCDTRPPKASASRPSPSSSPSPPSSSPPPPSSSPPPPPSPPPSPSPRADLAEPRGGGNTSRVFVHRRASADSKDEWVYAGARLTPGEFRAADTAEADEDLPEILRPAAARHRRSCAFSATGAPVRRLAKPALIDRPLRPPLAPIVERERAGVGTRVGESTERFATMERFLRDQASEAGRGLEKPVVPGSAATTVAGAARRDARGDSTSPPTALHSASRARCRTTNVPASVSGVRFAPRRARVGFAFSPRPAPRARLCADSNAACADSADSTAKRCSADSSPSRASPNGWRVSRRSGSSARTRARVGRGGAAQGGGPLAGGSRRSRGGGRGRVRLG